MTARRIALAAFLALSSSTGAFAACAFKNEVPIKSLSAGFEAWKSVTAAMGECGNFQAELDQDFRLKQPQAFAARPALYQIGGVASETILPLMNAGTIRPLDDLVAKHGKSLSPNQLIKMDGKIMAIAMMVNAQHLMYRQDIFDKLGLAQPKTYDDVLAAAQKIKASGDVPYPVGGTMRTGWNLAMEFVNMYLGQGGTFFAADGKPSIKNAQGAKSLETLKALSAFMDPEYLTGDSTFVQKQFQQGKIAIANFWGSRAGALDNAAESTVVGKVKMAAAVAAVAGGKPATTVWWDGIVIAKNATDAEAEAAFKLVLEGLDRDMVQAHNEDAVWLVEGFKPGRLAEGVIATLNAGAPSYPASTQMGLMVTALGNTLGDFFTGKTNAEQALASAEERYSAAAKEAGLLK